MNTVCKRKAEDVKIIAETLVREAMKLNALVMSASGKSPAEGAIILVDGYKVIITQTQIDRGHDDDKH